MLPVEAALLRPTAARWLKLLSLRPPVSVTRPILNVLAAGPGLVPPQAATNVASTRQIPRLNKRTGGFLIRPPLQVSCEYPSIRGDCNTQLWEILRAPCGRQRAVDRMAAAR